MNIFFTWTFWFFCQTLPGFWHLRHQNRCSIWLKTVHHEYVRKTFTRRPKHRVSSNSEIFIWTKCGWRVRKASASLFSSVSQKVPSISPLRWWDAHLARFFGRDLNDKSAFYAGFDRPKWRSYSLTQIRISPCLSAVTKFWYAIPFEACTDSYQICFMHLPNTKVYEGNWPKVLKKKFIEDFLLIFWATF